ncbi:MAG: ATPase inhibitor subunit zeta [Caulobacteraceae bacterium]
MSAFEDREKGFERKFASDQDQEFRAQSRAARMLGEWAAKKMGLESVDDYVRAVVRARTWAPAARTMWFAK